MKHSSKDDENSELIKLSVKLFNGIETALTSLSNDITYEELMNALELIVYFYIKTGTKDNNLEEQIRAARIFTNNIINMFLDNARPSVNNIH